MPLSELTHEKIKLLAEQGDALATAGRHREAIEVYGQAWDLLPEPQTDFDAATWILAALADAQFLVGEYMAGRDNLCLAMHCPDGIGNPFLHLRLGQCLHRLGDLDRATDELLRAYMAAGEEIFDEAPEDLAFLSGRVNLNDPDTNSVE